MSGKLKVKKALISDWVRGKKSNECLLHKSSCKGNGQADGKKICPGCFRAYYDRKTGRNVALDKINDDLYWENVSANPLTKAQEKSVFIRALMILTFTKVRDTVKIAKVIADRLDHAPAPVHEQILKVKDLFESGKACFSYRVTGIKKQMTREKDVVTDAIGSYRQLADREKHWGRVVWAPPGTRWPECRISERMVASQVKRFVAVLSNSREGGKDFCLTVRKSDPIPMIWLIENLGANGLVTGFGSQIKKYWLPQPKNVIQVLRLELDYGRQSATKTKIASEAIALLESIWANKAAA